MADHLFPCVALHFKVVRNKHFLSRNSGREPTFDSESLRMTCLCGNVFTLMLSPTIQADELLEMALVSIARRLHDTLETTDWNDLEKFEKIPWALESFFLNFFVDQETPPCSSLFQAVVGSLAFVCLLSFASCWGWSKLKICLFVMTLYRFSLLIELIHSASSFTHPNSNKN